VVGKPEPQLDSSERGYVFLKIFCRSGTIDCSGSNSPAHFGRAARGSTLTGRHFHDNQVVALVPMLSALDRFRLLDKIRGCGSE
jgi:hypothetical protein